MELVAHDKSTETIEMLREEIKADQKLLVATNITLTDSEAKNFWPIYDEYQKNLQKINQWMANSLPACADDFRIGNKSLAVE